MATIRQIGPGRRTTGNIDGINYYVRNGETVARAFPIMPVKAYTNPAALKRQAIFKFIQMHLKYHLGTIRQTFSWDGNRNPTNCYYKENNKGLTRALDTLADLYVAGEIVTIDDVEQAICDFAAANPKTICIGHLNGFDNVYLEGEWPSTITLHASVGRQTIIVLVAENGTTTTHYPDGTTTVVPAGESGGSGSNSGSGSGNESGSGSGSGSGSETPATVNAPTISGTTPFEETTTVTMSGPDGASIHYTTDGSVPTSASTQYTEALTLTATTTVKAIAVKDGVSSSVTTKTFTKGTGGGGSDTE